MLWVDSDSAEIFWRKLVARMPTFY